MKKTEVLMDMSQLGFFAETSPHAWPGMAKAYIGKPVRPELSGGQTPINLPEYPWKQEECLIVDAWATNDGIVVVINLPEWAISATIPNIVRMREWKEYNQGRNATTGVVE